MPWPNLTPQELAAYQMMSGGNQAIYQQAQQPQPNMAQLLAGAGVGQPGEPSMAELLARAGVVAPGTNPTQAPANPLTTQAPPTAPLSPYSGNAQLIQQYAPPPNPNAPTGFMYGRGSPESFARGQQNLQSINQGINASYAVPYTMGLPTSTQYGGANSSMGMPTGNMSTIFNNPQLMQLLMGRYGAPG